MDATVANDKKPVANAEKATDNAIRVEFLVDKQGHNIPEELKTVPPVVHAECILDGRQADFSRAVKGIIGQSQYLKWRYGIETSVEGEGQDLSLIAALPKSSGSTEDSVRYIIVTPMADGIKIASTPMLDSSDREQIAYLTAILAEMAVGSFSPFAEYDEPHRHMIKAKIFDFDGTTYQYVDKERQNALYEENNRKEEEFMVQNGFCADRVAARLVLDSIIKRCRKAGELDELVREFGIDRYEFLRATQPLTELSRFITPDFNAQREVFEPGFRTVLLTGAPRIYVDEVAGQMLHIDVRRYDEVFAGGEGGVTKASPLSYALTLRDVGVSPEEAVMIDDDTRNLGVAKGMGMWTIWMNPKFDPAKDRKPQGVDRVVRSLDEVSGAVASLEAELDARDAPN